MIKTVEPKKVVERITFPHCEPKVLHAPGECVFCDRHPDWQYLRQMWGIAFTGYEPEENKKELPDPATHARGGLNLVYKWYGNRPTINLEPIPELCASNEEKEESPSGSLGRVDGLTI